MDRTRKLTQEKKKTAVVSTFVSSLLFHNWHRVKVDCVLPKSTKMTTPSPIDDADCSGLDYSYGIITAAGLVGLNTIMILVLLCVKSYQENTSPFRSLIEKRNCYLALMIHTFDQSIDLGLIVEFYLVWNQDCGTDYAKRRHFYLFVIAVSAFVVYRLISCLLVMVRTHTKQSIFGILQLLDLYVYYGIIINYKYLRNKLSKPQKFFHYLECLFEAFPMILIKIFFIINTANDEFTLSDTLVIFVLVSLGFSLFSVMLSVVIQDLTYFSNDNDTTHASTVSNFGGPDGDDKNPISSKLLFFFRFFDILSRFSLLSMVWIVLDGLAVIGILAFEFIVLCVFSYKYSELSCFVFFVFFFYVQGVRPA